VPTKKPEGSARIDWVSLLAQGDFRLPAILKAIRILVRRARFGGLSAREQWFRLFADDVTDLSTLPIGLFDLKVVVLPRRLVPTTQADLATFCAKLIDRGEDAEHVELMLASWPAKWTLNAHAAALWSIREHDLRLYEEITRGRGRRALNRLSGRKKVGDLTAVQVEEIITRQLLLWSAMDVQMVATRARLSFVAPLGPTKSLLISTMRVLKPGTILRLMSQAHGMMTSYFENFLGDRPSDDFKPNGRDAKLIHYHAKRRLEAQGKAESEYLLELRESIPLIHRSSETMRRDIERLRTYGTEMLLPRVEKDGSVSRRDNTLRQFHAMWYDNLSPAAGMTVALFRFVMAERHLKQLVGRAASARVGLAPHLYEIDSLPALPADEGELRNIVARVMDLAHSSRRVHLKDEDWLSRIRLHRKQTVAQAASDPNAAVRGQHERAGSTFVKDALEFLRAMGQRERDAWHERHSGDHRQSTYWKLDVVPDRRLVR
jgi:hypothetical protein